LGDRGSGKQWPEGRIPGTAAGRFFYAWTIAGGKQRAAGISWRSWAKSGKRSGKIVTVCAVPVFFVFSPALETVQVLLTVIAEDHGADDKGLALVREIVVVSKKSGIKRLFSPLGGKRLQPVFQTNLRQNRQNIWCPSAIHPFFSRFPVTV
jgi:hypothetical protein